MSTIPQWIIGRNAVATIAPVTVATDGTVTVGTVTTLTAILDEVSTGLENQTEQIVPYDVTINQNVKIGSGQTITLIEILNPAAVLAEAGMAGDYAQVTIARGGKTWTFVGLIMRYEEPIRRGKSVGTLTLSESGIAPTYD